MEQRPLPPTHPQIVGARARNGEQHPRVGGARCGDRDNPGHLRAGAAAGRHHDVKE
jgi:hypothetical protein